MNRNEAEGWFIILAINQLMDSNDDEDPGCCFDNCGPCSALYWARENSPSWINDAVRWVWDGTPGGLYAWQNADGSIDWRQLQAQWDRHKGCMYSPETNWTCSDDAAVWRAHGNK